MGFILHVQRPSIASAECKLILIVLLMCINQRITKKLYYDKVFAEIPVYMQKCIPSIMKQSCSKCLEQSTELDKDYFDNASQLAAILLVMPHLEETTYVRSFANDPFAMILMVAVLANNSPRTHA